MTKTNLPPIVSVTIRENGAKSAAAEAGQQCSSFKLSNREVLAYLQKSGQVSEHDYYHMLDWSPCHATGEVVFNNGTAGVWGIQQLRAGSLKLSDGRIIYLYCPQCRAKGFAAAEQ